MVESKKQKKEVEEIKVTLHKWVQKHDYTEYIFKVGIEKDDLHFMFKDRYSDMHEKMKKIRKKLDKPKKFPKFPGKKMFGHKKEKFVNHRAEELVAFWNAFMNYKKTRGYKKTWKYLKKEKVNNSDSNNLEFYNAFSCIMSAVHADGESQTLFEKLSKNYDMKFQL